MKSRILASGIAALAFTAMAPAAQAGVSEDFAGCDGLKKPKRKDDGMRGQATEPARGFFGGKSTRNAAMTLASCDRALQSDKLLPEQTLRRAHLLRARAVAKLSLDDQTGALVDLDAAENAIASYRGERLFDRSMGVSLDLLRAIAFAETGRRDQALVLAEKAATLRPYAVEVQRAATLLRGDLRDDTLAKKDLWARFVQLDPGSRDMVARIEVKGGDWARIVELDDGELPTFAAPAFADNPLALDKNAVMQWLTGFQDAMHRAYAHAALGHSEHARAIVRTTEAAVAALAIPEQGAKPAATALLAPLLTSKIVAPMAAHVEARIAINEGRIEDARALMAGKEMSGSTGADLQAALGDEPATSPNAATLTKIAVTDEGESENALGINYGVLAKTLLIKPDTAADMIAYRQSRSNAVGSAVGKFLFGGARGNGTDRTYGFQSNANADGTVTVEYMGDTTSGPVVQEMTLLRAAELAQEAGHGRLALTAREDYQRYLTRSQYGIEQDRTLMGYKTVLTVRFVGAEEKDAFALDAAEIIDALGPIYYDSGA